ncbi:MAG TPA: hypothetical protein VGH49_12320 [Xanthobacteraceae bacterium]|jgi:hypothetical protein
MAAIGRLPRRFPVGTRYVLEGVPAKDGMRVISRIIVLPDGQEFDVTDEAAMPRPSRHAVRSRGQRQRTKH